MPLPPWEMAKSKGIRSWLREHYYRVIQPVKSFADFLLRTDQMRFILPSACKSTEPNLDASDGSSDPFWQVQTSNTSRSEEQEIPSWTQPFPASPLFNPHAPQNHTFHAFEASIYPTQMPTPFIETSSQQDLPLIKNLPQPRFSVVPISPNLIVALLSALCVYLILLRGHRPSQAREEKKFLEKGTRTPSAGVNAEFDGTTQAQETHQTSEKKAADLVLELEEKKSVLETTNEDNNGLRKQVSQMDIQMNNHKALLTRLAELEASEESRMQASEKLKKELTKLKDEKRALEESNLILQSQTTDLKTDVDSKKKTIWDYTQSFKTRNQETAKLKDTIDKLQEEVSVLEGKTKSKDEHVSKLEEMIKSKDEQMSALGKQLKIAVKEKAQEFSDTKLESEARIIEFCGEKEELKREISRLQDLKSSKDRAIGEKGLVIQETQKENAELKKKVAGLEIKDAELQKHVEVQDACLKSQRNIIDKNEGLKHQVKALENDRIALQAELKKANESTCTDKERINGLWNRVTKLQAESLALGEDKALLQEQLTRATTSESSMKEQNSDLLTRADDLRTQTTALERDKATLQIELEKATKSTSYWQERSDGFSKTIASHEAYINTKKLEWDDGIKTITALEMSKAALAEENRSLNKALEEKDQALVEAHTTNEQLEEARSKTTIQLHAMQAQNLELKTISEKLDITVTQSQTENEQLRDANETLNRTLMKIQNENRKIKEANNDFALELRNARLRLRLQQQTVAEPEGKQVSVKLDAYDGEADTELSDAETVIPKPQSNAYDIAAEVSKEDAVVTEEAKSISTPNEDADADSNKGSIKDEKFVLKAETDAHHTKIPTAKEEIPVEEVIHTSAEKDEDEPHLTGQNILPQSTEPCEDPISPVASVNPGDGAIQYLQSIDNLLTDDIGENPRVNFVEAVEIHAPQSSRQLEPPLLPENAAAPAIRKQDWMNAILCYSVVKRRPKVLFPWEIWEKESGERKYKRDFQQPHSVQNERRRAWAETRDLVYVSDPPYKHPSRPWWTVPGGAFVQSYEDELRSDQQVPAPESGLLEPRSYAQVAVQAPVQEPNVPLDGQKDISPRPASTKNRQCGEYNEVHSTPANTPACLPVTSTAPATTPIQVTPTTTATQVTEKQLKGGCNFIPAMPVSTPAPTTTDRQNGEYKEARATPEDVPSGKSASSIPSITRPASVTPTTSNMRVGNDLFEGEYNSVPAVPASMSTPTTTNRQCDESKEIRATPASTCASVTTPAAETTLVTVTRRKGEYSFIGAVPATVPVSPSVTTPATKPSPTATTTSTTATATVSTKRKKGVCDSIFATPAITMAPADHQKSEDNMIGVASSTTPMSLTSPATPITAGTGTATPTAATKVKKDIYDSIFATRSVGPAPTDHQKREDCKTCAAPTTTSMSLTSSASPNTTATAAPSSIKGDYNEVRAAPEIIPVPTNQQNSMPEVNTTVPATTDRRKGDYDIVFAKPATQSAPAPSPAITSRRKGDYDTVFAKPTAQFTPSSTPVPTNHTKSGHDTILAKPATQFTPTTASTTATRRKGDYKTVYAKPAPKDRCD